MAAREILGALRRTRLASRKTRHEPGDGGGQHLACVRRENLVFRLIVLDAGSGKRAS
ncbi:MAG: hypothetical protein ACREC4_11030 [Methylocella sp.]